MASQGYDAIYYQVINAFKKAFGQDKEVADLVAKLRSGSANMQEALDFASIIGGYMGRSVQSNVLPLIGTEEMTQVLLRELMSGSIKYSFDLAQQFAGHVQDALNEAAGMQIKSVTPKFNKERGWGIADELLNRDVQGNTIVEQIRQATMSAVDDTVRTNADFQFEAGLEPEVHRIPDSKACKWCRSLAGRYRYQDVKDTGNDVWRRHTNCNCLITFVSKKGSQNASTKRWYKDDNSAAIAARKERAEQS